MGTVILTSSQVLLLAVVAMVLLDHHVADEQARRPRGQTLHALHCPPCERVHCSPRRALRLQCKGGVTTGVCGCCPVCARTVGESCGGAWDHLGKCDEGLLCITQDPLEGAPDTEPQGICREAVRHLLQSKTCPPECTWEYCRDHPFETCSAKSVALEKQACRGSCQRTSCSSCLVLHPPRCPQVCADDEHTCLKQFGECVHNQLSRLHQPDICHQNLESNTEGFFMCLVPGCQKDGN
ncbi:cysteine-rich motor neuron 1 protein-like [Arapaima gigas]